MKATGEVMAIDRSLRGGAAEGGALAGDRRPLAALGGPALAPAAGRRSARHRRPQRRAPVGADGRAAPRRDPSTSCTARTGIDPWFLDRLQSIVQHGEAPAGRAADAGPAAGRPSASASPTARSATLARPGLPEQVRELRQELGHPPRLQDGRHLRRRVRGRHAVLLHHLRGGERGAARSTANARSSSAPARSASARASSSTTARCTPPGRCSEAGYKSDHDQLQPRDRLDRLRHHRPPLLRAPGRGERRARSSHNEAARRQPDGDAPGRSSSSAARRRSTSPSRWTAPARRSSAPRVRDDRPGRGPAPLRGLPRRPRHPAAAGRRRHAPSRTRSRRRSRSATRCWCARATSSAGGRWRSSRTPPSWCATCARPPSSPQGKPVLIDKYLRGQRGRGRRDLRRRATCSSPASWSTSSAPACTPATRWPSTPASTSRERDVDTLVDYTHAHRPRPGRARA